MDTSPLIDQLCKPEAYPHEVDSPVQTHETHISLIFLAGPFAYKVKKPVANEFLDYSTLAKRRHACEEELRLGVRYADDLYLQVVPIVRRDEQVVIGGEGEPIEYAVKMKRFPANALLSTQLSHHRVTPSDMRQLAIAVAAFHRKAPVSGRHDADALSEVLHQAMLNFKHLYGKSLQAEADAVTKLEGWTESTFQEHHERFKHRFRDGFVRECHGDLHCDNVVMWNDHWVPFDGIEFNASLSWIDILDDASFLMVDLIARDRKDLARIFVNAYLEQTGDYDDLTLLRWYAVYRLMVRAKVAEIRMSQIIDDPTAVSEQIETARHRIRIADELIRESSPKLWITHGLSGSGKTTGSEAWVAAFGAIRIRSDVERKRLLGLDARERAAAEHYDSATSTTTYQRLQSLARAILSAGYPVIVDATFLRENDRRDFRSLADQEGVPFEILHFTADEGELRDRITQRAAAQADASDADLAVLRTQLATQQPLTAQEQPFVIDASANRPL